jgi:hypothetical protein
VNRTMFNSRRHSQQGAVLLVSLILLLAMTLIGVAAIDTSTLQSQMSRNSLEAITRYQIALNEIQGQYYDMFSWEKREDIIKSNVDAAANPAGGITYAGPTIGVADADMITHNGSDPYDLAGNLVFTGESTGAVHGYSINQHRILSYEVNIIATLNGTSSDSNQTQGVSHTAPIGQN